MQMHKTQITVHFNLVLSPHLISLLKRKLHDASGNFVLITKQISHICRFSCTAVPFCKMVVVPSKASFAESLSGKPFITCFVLGADEAQQLRAEAAMGC